MGRRPVISDARDGVHDGGGTIRNSEGGVNEAGVFWKPARWCDYSGRIQTGAERRGGDREPTTAFEWTRPLLRHRTQAHRYVGVPASAG